MMRYIDILMWFILFFGCVHVEIPNTKKCAVSGSLVDGAICAETLTGETSEMNAVEYVYFLEPNTERGGAICESADDFNKEKTALEQACRLLGKKCTYEMKRIIKTMGEFR